MTAIGTKQENRWHLELQQRWVDQYSFYINDREWGRMFVRLCPYFPFSARLCLNQHHWIAHRLQERGVRFRQSTNAFTHCSDPAVLQQIADSLTARDLARCGAEMADSPVEAVGTFRTKSGELVKSSDSLIDYNPIMPGQTSPFSTGTSDNPQMERCELGFKFLLGGSEIDYTIKEKKK